MPNRIIREGIVTSKKVTSMSEAAQLFYVLLLLKVDDFACYDAHPTLLRAACYPYRIDEKTDDQILCYLDECYHAGLIQLYSVDGKDYLYAPNFKQQVRQVKRRYPEPPPVHMDKGSSNGIHSTVGTVAHTAAQGAAQGAAQAVHQLDKTPESCDKHNTQPVENKEDTKHATQNATQNATQLNSESLEECTLLCLGSSKEGPVSRVRGRAIMLSPSLDTQEFRNLFEEFLEHCEEGGHMKDQSSVRRIIIDLERMGTEKAMEAINHALKLGWWSIHEVSEASSSFHKKGHGQSHPAPGSALRNL